LTLHAMGLNHTTNRRNRSSVMEARNSFVASSDL